MNKKILLMFTFLFTFFMFKDNVFAVSLDRKDITTECIYSDGSLFVTGYSESGINTTREAAQISSNDSASNDNISEFSVLNSTSKDNGRCSRKVTAAVLSRKTRNKETKADGSVEEVGDEYVVNVAYYKFDDDNPTITYGEAGTPKPWYMIFTSDEEYSNTLVSGAKTYSLISERIYINNEKILSADGLNKCYYVRKSTQASESNSYLTFYLFDNITLMENNGMITSYSQTLQSCPSTDVIYLNDPSQKIDTSKNSPRYFYNAEMFDYKDTADDEYSAKYERTDEPDPNQGDNGKNACDDIPKTVEVLKTIIKVLQIGVPAFVIILTSVDIFRMVVADNLVEELPKRKKTIIIRFIIMLVFFFLPLFINVILSIMYDSSDWFKNDVGIKNINCLFQ